MSEENHYCIICSKYIETVDKCEQCLGWEEEREKEAKELRYKKFLELLEEFGADCPWFEDCSERAFENYSGREI